MDARTPADWVDAAADRDPDAPALAFADGVVTYVQLADQVAQRARSLHGRSADASGSDRSTVTVPAALDLPTIVDLLAHPVAGLVPVPYADGLPVGYDALAGSAADGAVLAVPTSGSSGNRRLVRLSMANIAASVSASRTRLRTGPDDRWLACLPLDHVGGISVLFRTFEAGGAAVVARFDDALPDLIERTRPSVASFVPTMLHRLLERDQDLVAGIGTVLVGGGRLPQTLAERAERASVRVVATYGSTETASQVSTMVPGEPVRHAGYVGTPLDGFTVTVDEPDDTGVGTLLVDGPAVFAGYDGARSGPHRTSDLGRLDPDGSLTVVGRSDDVVVTGGVNVSLVAVAEAVARSPGIRDVAVVGLADEEWGVRIGALVESDASVDEVSESIDAVVHGPSRPRVLHVVEAIPLLPNGKHDLAAVRTLLGEADLGDR